MKTSITTIAKRKRALQKTINKSRDELNKYEVIEKVKQNQKFVGKCFKYINSYGSGEKWPLYSIATGITSSGNLTAFLFERTSHDEINIRVDKWAGIYLMGKEISKEEFLEAWAELKTHISDAADVAFEVLDVK